MEPPLLVQDLSLVKQEEADVKEPQCAQDYNAMEIPEFFGRGVFSNYSYWCLLALLRDLDDILAMQYSLFNHVLVPVPITLIPYPSFSFFQCFSVELLVDCADQHSSVRDPLLLCLHFIQLQKELAVVPDWWLSEADSSVEQPSQITLHLPVHDGLVLSGKRF